jgi:hypothetical protein
MVHTSYRNEATSKPLRVKAREHWPVLVLATGGVLTLAWSALLLWAASTTFLWLIS